MNNDEKNLNEEEIMTDSAENEVSNDETENGSNNDEVEAENEATETNETSTSEESGIELPTETVEDNIEVMFLDPSPVTSFPAGDTEIDIVHEITLGDILTSTLLAMLIIVTLLSRLLGRR